MSPSRAARSSGGALRLARGVGARKCDRRGDHCLHFVEILEHLRPLLVIADELGAQPHARDRRAQVVGNGRDHERTVVDETPDALLHQVEGPGRVPDFGGPRFAQRRRIDVGAEPIQEGKERQPANAVERLARWERFAEAGLESVKSLNAAFKPLYEAMTDEQKKHADRLLRHRHGR